jgi:hypothetical protein
MTPIFDGIRIVFNPELLTLAAHLGLTSALQNYKRPFIHNIKGRNPPISFSMTDPELQIGKLHHSRPTILNHNAMP